jgi:hypothetical protein
MMIDLGAEYLAALGDTSSLRRRELRLAGVPQYAIDLAGPAFTRIRPFGPLYEPDPASDLAAFLLPVRCEHAHTPESLNPGAALAAGDIVDLVAFDPGLASRWLLRRGNAEWLGACPPQYLEPPPVMLHRTPLDWLRASCEGLVCLVLKPLEILRFLVRFATVIVDDVKHAAELQAVLDRPFLLPTILVRES